MPDPEFLHSAVHGVSAAAKHDRDPKLALWVRSPTKNLVLSSIYTAISPPRQQMRSTVWSAY